MNGKWVLIPKRGGGTRRIYVPTPEEKARARQLLPKLNLAYLDLCRKMEFSEAYIVVHGFRPNHSPITNALPHIPYQITITMDLEDFFDSCKRNMFEDWVLSKLPPSHRREIEPHLDLLFPGGIAAQGMPTSPVITNMIFLPADRKLYRVHKCCVYTRYADDLSFSLEEEDKVDDVMMKVKEIIHDFGFRINARKTKIQHARNGRRVICGVAIDRDGLYAPRRVRRRLRAAQHQGNEAHARGLAEWCAMKVPSTYLRLIAEYQPIKFCSKNNPCHHMTRVGHLWEYIKQNNDARTYLSIVKFGDVYNQLFAYRMCPAHWIHFVRFCLHTGRLDLLSSVRNMPEMLRAHRFGIGNYLDAMAEAIAGLDLEYLEATIAMIALG